MSETEEDELDAMEADRAYSDYLKNPSSRPLIELLHENGLDRSDNEGKA